MRAVPPSRPPAPGREVPMTRSAGGRTQLTRPSRRCIPRVCQFGRVVYDCGTFAAGAGFSCGGFVLAQTRSNIDSPTLSGTTST